MLCISYVDLLLAFVVGVPGGLLLGWYVFVRPDKYPPPTGPR